MSNTFDKLSVLDSFIEEVNSYLPEIEANLERLTQSPGDMDALDETHRRTHTIGGSASMMDFSGLAHVAHGMEDILGDVLDGLATLDQPTIELLQRSLARLHRLLGGIQHGIDEKAIEAEDDADYTQYRTQQDAAAQGVPGGMITPEYVNQPNNPSTFAQGPGGGLASPFDDMLASFRPQQVVDSAISWSEDSRIRAEFPLRPDVQFPVPPMQPAQHAQFDAPRPVESGPSSAPPSALELLAGSGRRPELSPSSMPYVPPTPPVAPLTPRPQAEGNNMFPISLPSPASTQPFPPPVANPAFLMPPASQEQPSWASQPPQMSPAFPSQMSPAFPPQMSPQPARPENPGNNAGAFDLTSPTDLSSSLQVYQDMQGEVQVLEDQAVSLRRTLSQLRLAASVIETQRTEFKGFLDGSRDALDRMEDWAGKAMGLNLRNSPEQVRRYLPLSVMWVANSKLKKVLDMLVQMSSGVEGTEELMQLALHDLHESIADCGEIFQRPASASEAEGMAFTAEPGWTAWDMQVKTDNSSMRERVTFERQGDLAALRAELESQLREELRREYESRPAVLAARAELERQVREEVLQELNAKQQLQDRVSGGGETFEGQLDLESHMRNEMEIQVRREFLSQLTGEDESDGTAVSLALQFPQMSSNAPSAPANSAVPVSRSTPPAPFPTAAPLQTLTPAEKRSAMSSDFGEEAGEIFRLEAEEHLQTISMHVSDLEHAPTNLEPIQGIRRATHTLKGAAGMMGFRAIADLCHISEDMLDGVMEGTVSISPTVLSLILDTAEALDLLINSKDSTVENENAVGALRIRYADLLGEQASLASINNIHEDEIDPDDDQDTAHPPIPSIVGRESQTVESSMPDAARADLSVRVSLSKLDELVNLFGELLVNRTILEERIQRLNRLVADAGVSSARLRDVGQKLESRFEAATLPSGRSVQVMPGEGDQTLSLTGTNGKGGRVAPAYLADFDELELDRYTEFHQLARGLSEGISDMSTLSNEMETVIRDCEGVFSRESRLSTTFQDRLMKARLVPLSTMIPRLYRTARAVALKQRKEFELVLEGQNTEVDRTVIEEIAGPLLHLMRNAVNHALETPEVRLQRGKSSAGQIKLLASYEGNQVVITVRDDGTGLDPERIRNEAIHRGLIRANQVLTDGEIVDLIFRPGFSTAEVLSEEGGRGVGLDVVRDSVSRLRGSMEVESMPGQGTAFTMKFPTSLAIQNAMMVQVGDQQFAIPTATVEAIGRLDNFKHTTYGGRPAILVQNRPYPLSSLAQLLGLKVSDLNEKAPLLLVSTARQNVALVVDDIKGRLDVVIKNLGPHLRNVHGIAGGTVLGNGRVVLILELHALLSSSGAIRGAVGASAPAEVRGEVPNRAVQVERRSVTGAMPPVPKPEPVAPQGKHILVVDDSPSVRRVVSTMLKQHRWEVQTARDGVEALEMIALETPAAVLLDIEMPRMDGYELMATVRAQEQYRSLPLVVLTSRAASKHQQRATQLGANAYVVKPYQDEELIRILNNLVYGATV